MESKQDQDQRREATASRCDTSTNEPVSLEDLLWSHFFENQVEGVMREQQGTPGNLQAIKGFSTTTMDLKWAARHSIQVEDFPDVVVPIFLKRFSFETDCNAAQRNSRPVKIPLLLDFKPFAHNYNGSNGASAPTQLRLHAVICHLGEQVSSGHYVAFVRNGQDGSGGWLFLDDTRPAQEQVSLLDTFERAPGVLTARDAYVVLYEAVPPGGLTDYEVAIGLQEHLNQEGGSA